MATADWYEKTNKHFGDILDESASRYPHKEFIVFKDQRITYAQFQHSVNQFARGLLKLGVKKDENVALWMSNCAEWPVAQFAVYKIGAALLPLNTRFVKREVEYCLSQSDASTLILRDRFLGEKIDAYGMLLDLIPELPQSEAGHLKSEKFPKLKRVILLGEDRRDGTFDFHEVLESGQAHTQDDVLQRAQASVSPFDVMNVVYTSGTTGFPKGGLSPHRTNCSALYQYVRRIGITEQDRTLLTVPFFTNFGVTYVSALSILVGMSIIVHESFSPEAAMQAIEKERIT